MSKENRIRKSTFAATNHAGRCSRVLILPLLLLLTASLAGQLSQRYASEVQLPNGGGTYSITFQAKFTGGTVAGPEGSIILAKGNKTRLKLTDFRVNGPDPEVAKAIRVKLVLPPSGGGHSLNISSMGLDQVTLTINEQGRLGLLSDVSIIYQESKIKGEKFNLTRVFSFSDLQEEDPLPPPPGIPEDNQTAAVENPPATAAASDNSVKKPVPQEEPQWEQDFNNRSISPEEFVDNWSGKIGQVPSKRRLTSLIEQKLRLIPLEPSVREVSSNRYELTFAYVNRVTLDTVTGGTAFEVVTDEKVGAYGQRMVVVVSDVGTYKLHLEDNTKVNGTAIVGLDNLLGGELSVTGDSVTFTFQGGVPPYALLFYQKGGLKGEMDIGYDSVRTMSIAQLEDKEGKKLEPGTFAVKLRDQQKTITWNYGGAVVTVPKPAPKPVDTTIPLMAGGGLAALALLLIIRGVKRRQRRSRIRENLNESGTRPAKPSPAPAAPPKKPAGSGHESNNGQLPSPEIPAPAPPEIPLPANPAEVEPAHATTPIFREITEENSVDAMTDKAAAAAPGGFRVTRRAKTDNSTRPFHPDQRPQDFLPLHLEKNWAESRVATVYFNKQSIFVLDDFLRRENTSKIAGSGAVAKDGGWERNEAIPEIGGMLMGQYRLGEDGRTYRVSVEEFIPLKAKTQNVVKVQIDPMSLARDLSAAQDDHPELTVIGWFHTHPGHGLFLSQPDLKVQHGQFREPYHFAMEIDSLTENLDTAFFTYLPSGKMNNRDTRRPDAEWFSWSEIEKFTRRNAPN